MKDDWKICLSLFNHDCEGWIYTHTYEVHSLPFLPRVGDTIYPPDDFEERLTAVIKECWRKEHCEECPFCYHSKKSEDDISISDFNHVTDVIFSVDEKQINIVLDKI